MTVIEAMSIDERRIVERSLPYTMTGPERLLSLVDAVRYCVQAEVPGSFAECGVWKGGSVLAMILTLQACGAGDRDIYLYDTFEGMTEPTEYDTSTVHPPAQEIFEEARTKDEKPFAGFFDSKLFNENAVRATLSETGYPEGRLHFVRGPVEETVPAHLPERIALLRLDTDWYESTRHELEHMYPRLERGGVLIIDDYGHWDGSRRAVDEYFAQSPETLLLQRIDYSARMAVRP
jgi:hypothetical protein